MTVRRLISRHSCEVLVVGDFVRLISGGPIGLVTETLEQQAKVSWLTVPIVYSLLPQVCLRTVPRT